MLRWLFFNLAYYHRPIWDTGISPPELVEFIANHTPGQALELGCGTGTNAISLAKAGWQVTGVDFSFRAISKARRKARRNGVHVDFHLGDVTKLEGIKGPFDLILDIGCFHSLAHDDYAQYAANVERLLTQAGTYLLYVFFREQAEPIGPGISQETVSMLTNKFDLIQRLDGSERSLRPSAWLTMQRKP